MNANGTLEKQEATHRWELARAIRFYSIGGISLIAGLVVIFAADKASASQTVLTAVLPLLAAWVSTVLAYYYSSESIESATKNVKSLISPQEKLKAIKAVDKMIKLQDMTYFTFTDTLKVHDMLDELKASKKGLRFPFLGDKKQPQFILHKSNVDAALVERSVKGDDITQLTLKDLFDKVDGLKTVAEGSFGVVGENATLADAKAEMSRIKGAQDIFVTSNGRKDGMVAGWITNDIIEQSSKV